LDVGTRHASVVLWTGNWSIEFLVLVLGAIGRGGLVCFAQLICFLIEEVGLGGVNLMSILE
jgi:hypothetical protein